VSAARGTMTGLVAIAAGTGVFIVQMFVGLNDASEYSNPWYLQAARWLALALVVGGALWSGLAWRTAHRGRR